MPELIERVGVVGCCKQKRTCDTAARSMYLSPLFRLCRDYCDKHTHRWVILSAHYGVLDPDTIIAPYDLSLNQMSRPEQRSWLFNAHEDLMERFCPSVRFIVLTGALYGDCVPASCPRLCIWKQEPLAGMAIGKRLQWLKKRA